MTRARYLFDLANLCSLPPPQVNGLTVVDFGHLLLGIRVHKAAHPPLQL